MISLWCGICDNRTTLKNRNEWMRKLYVSQHAPSNPAIGNGQIISPMHQIPSNQFRPLANGALVPCLLGPIVPLNTYFRHQ
jgi:hypothetical protein